MSTPIPGFATQMIPTAETVQVSTGTQQSLVTTRYYYLVSNRTAAANGQSLLFAIKTLLDASLAGTVWTVKLTLVSGLYKIQISHNNGSSRTVTFSQPFAANLGFSSNSFAVASGTTVTAAAPSVWWWTPDMMVSATGTNGTGGTAGSDVFDPSISYGVPVSAGASQRAPDMTAVYVQNGVQWSATYVFSMVQYFYKVRAQVGHTNEDLETWWLNGPAQGRRFLWWRNRDNATGSNAPVAGSSTPFNYIEYTPQETLRAALPAAATTPTSLLNWDVTLDVWVTENGETPLTT